MNHVQGNVQKDDVVWTLCLSSCVRFVGAGDRVFQVRERDKGERER